MAFINANQLKQNANIQTDICIIGSGAAGLAVAHGLNHTNLRVLILEAGGLKYEHELHTDYEYDFPNWFRGEWAATRTRAIGGTTIAWYGRCTQMEPINFEERDWVPNSGWPIDVAEIDQYKRQALEFLHVPEPAGIDPDFWGHNITREAFRNGDLEPRNFIWSDPTDMSVIHGRWLKKSPNISLYYYAFAQEIEPSPNNDHAERVLVKSLNGSEFQVEASTIIVAGGTVENCRLLLLSQKNSQHGLGNEYDNVGRYYMDHPRIEGESRITINKSLPNWENIYQFLDETDTPYGVLQYILAMSEDFQKEHELLNHCTMVRPVFYEMRSNSYLAAKRIFHAAKDRSLSDLHTIDALKAAYGFRNLVSTGIKKAMGAPLTISHMELIDQLEQEPNRHSRVTLNQRKDRFGQPLTNIEWHIDDSTTHSLRVFHQLIADHLQQNNLGTLDSPLLKDPDHVPDYTDACHPAGTTRMSATPKDGVVDKNCLVHGYDNLYVTGGSVFPTSGHENPTLTIVALGLRLADHIKQTVRSNKLSCATIS